MTMKRLLLFAFVLFASLSAKSQCPNDNTIWGTPITLTGPGDYNGYTNVWPGDYIVVNVCMGAKYTFTMCDNATIYYDAEMTLRNDATGVLLAYNDDFCSLLPQITWTATFTGAVRVLIDDNAGPCTHTVPVNGMDLIAYQLSNCGTSTVPSGPCGTDAGTYTSTLNGVAAGSPIYLCRAGGANCFSLTSNNDFILPSPDANVGIETPELMWAIYTGVPNTAIDPSLDPNWSGFYWTGQDLNDCDGSSIPTIVGAASIWYVPITCDDSDNNGDPNGAIHHDQDGDGCFDLGTPILVHYLAPIAVSITTNFCAGTAQLTITGGSPQINGSNYGIVNTGPGSITGTPVTHGGTITVSGLTNGQIISLSITDPQGCSLNYTSPVLSFDAIPPTIACPATQTLALNASCQATLPNYTGLATTGDNCGAGSVTVTQSPAPGTIVSGTGTTVITLTATDQTGNTSSCTFNVTRVDNIAPTITCPGTQTLSLGAGCTSSLPNYTGSAITSDNCSAVTVTQSPAAGSSVTGIGTTVVTLTATDASGNTTSCTFNVNRVDNTAPTITCPATQTVSANASCQGVLGNYVGMATTSDNCSAVTVTQSPASGTVFAGSQTVTLTGTDASGNTSSCTFQVNVVDNTAPTITCPGPQTLILNASCQATLPNYTGMATTSDNCSAVTVTQSPAIGSTVSGTGTTTITLTATDATGNTTSCTFTLTKIDNIAPTITCPATQTVPGNASCQGTLGNYTGMAVTSDNCSAVTVTQSPAAGTLISGSQVVTLTATDASGNASNCTFTVNVIDNSAPTITCPGNQTLPLGGACTASLPDYTGLVTTSDNCSAVTVTQSPASGSTITGVTSTTITMTATDASGNSSTCTFSVNTIDNTAPTITCPGNQTLTLNASCQAALPDYTGMATTSDNCSAVTVTQSPVAGTTVTGAGSTTITLTATDANGNSSSCTFTVTRVDNTAPSITCPGNQTVVANALCQFVMPNYIPLVSSTDNCGGVTVTQSPAPGTTLSGTQTVTMTSTDLSGNSVTCTFQVLVTDNLAPTITCPGNQTGNVNASCQFILPDYTTLATALDNCTVSPTITQSPAAGATVGIGTTLVTLTATDANGNSSTCTFNVVVSDNTPPTLTCPPTQTLNLNASCQGQLPDYTTLATATDNCTAVTITQSPAIGTLVSGVGSTTVTLTATDAYGNMTTCTFTVNRVDNTPPTITCPGNQTAAANAACQFTMIDYVPLVIATDNCSAVTVTQSPAAGTLVSGTQTVTMTATDANGNSSTCTFQVVVTDNTPPTITCPGNQTANVNATCQFSIIDYTTLASASDNCTVSPTITQSPAAGTLVGIGTTTVTLTATDANGNSTSCTFNVVVTDNIAPVVTCPGNQTLNLNATCQVAMPDYTPMVTASDNCSAVTLTQSPAAGSTITGVSTTTVTITGTDASGNTTSCTFDVNTVDVTAPSITCPGNQTAAANVSCQFTMIDYTPMVTTSDNCSAVTVTQSPAAGTLVSGTQTVTMTAMDASGNTSTCTFQVIVNDNTPPTVSNCPSNQNEFADNTCSFILPDYTTIPTVSDNCTVTPTVTQSPIAGTSITTGTTTVTLTVSDANGNSTTCTFDVIVADTTSPVITCGSDITTCDPVVTFTVPTATDNCSGVTVAQTDGTGLSSGSTFPVGTTTLQFTATDASGNTAICTFDVTVEAPPSTAAAGPDQLLCGVSSATMAANTPTSGTGTWTVVSGSGSFSNANDPLATITGLTTGPNVFLWTITNGTCTPSVDTVIIDLGVAPSPANAGADQTICGSSATMAANAASSGTGTWTNLAGSGTFANANDPASSVSGLTFGTNSFIWTITSGSCPSTSDTITITTEEPPTTATTSGDMLVCDTATLVTVSGNVPTVGTGVWTITGAGTIASPVTDVTDVTGFSSGTQMTWTIVNGTICPPSSSTLTIFTEVCVQIVIPTGFTPDGDGTNDVWNIPGLDAAYPDCRVQVFTRWGAKIFSSDGYANPWDGTYNGQNMPLGSYYYIIDYNDGTTEPAKGTVTIIR